MKLAIIAGDGIGPEVTDAARRVLESRRHVLLVGDSQSAMFVTAFESFHEMCRGALNPNISAQAIEEMLVQHLLTERTNAGGRCSLDLASNRGAPSLP